MSRQFSRDFLLEVAKGKVSGHTSVFPFGIKDNILQTESTLWDSDGDFTWPIGDESWEILSDSASDILGGTGANIAFVSGLDTNFDSKTELVNLNGITPVVLTRTDWNRIQEVIIVFSGSNQSNAGTITLRVAGGGLTRSICKPGKSSSFNGFFTVPNEKYRFLATVPFFIPKGEDVKIDFLVKVDSTNTWLSFAEAPFYQSSFTFEQKLFGTLPPKTDVELRVSSINDGITCTVGIEMLEIDANLVNL